MRQTSACLVALTFFILAARAAAQVPDHLECYKIKDSAPRTPYTADLAGLAAEPGCQVKVPAKLLCVATTKSNVSPTPPEAGNGSSVGRFLCYKVKCPKGAPDALTIRDQFGSRSVEPKVSKLLCAPELPSSVCGNGVPDDGEACDDGNTETESSCDYGQAFCTRCDATCSAVLNLTGPVCGDGSINGPEACDDNNTNACGTCNGSCTAFQQPSAATGFILAVESALLVDGDTFTLDDGIGGSTVFEFDTAGNGVAFGNTAIAAPVGASAPLMAQGIRGAIQSSILNISASTQYNLVLLANNIQSGLGNQPIIETVINSNFFVDGMQGGAGGDCGSGVGCTADSDCASGTCGTNNPGTCD
jgi:hypothetical protein